MAKRDIADEIATEITEWIESMSDDIAEALIGSPFASDVVQPSMPDALAYWRAKLFLPDGTPNPAGRDEILARYGANEYEDIAKALAGSNGVLPPVPMGVTNGY